MSRELRKSCQRLVADLGLPRPFSLGSLLGRVEERRGRRIHILPIPSHAIPSGPCGLWIETRRNDYVFYDGDTTPFHQGCIIFHEFGHMLSAGEESGMGADSLDMNLLLPHLDPLLIQRVLGRDGYTGPEEEKAETIARLIIDHSVRAAGARPGVMGRLDDVLGARALRAAHAATAGRPGQSPLSNDRV